MRLTDFILENKQEILLEWEDFARTLTPAAAGMSSLQLRDHASAMLESIADDLRTPQSRDEQIAKSRGAESETLQMHKGELHGQARLESQFTIEQLVSEYRALRSSVLRLWGEAKHTPAHSDIDDVVRFNEAIDQLAAASVLSFARKTRQVLDAQVQRRDQFLAMLAHELRNPLSPISAAAALLKTAKRDSAIIDDASNIISRQAAHMSALIDDLLDVSRVTGGKVKLRRESLDLRGVVADAVEQVAPRTRILRHALNVAALPDPVMVKGDKKRLVQVMSNLLINAAEYTPSGGTIDVLLELHDDQLAVVVEDTGVGMAADFIPHAFDLFTQAMPTSDRSSGGLGLGLPLVKSLVELHAGRVTCASPGLGLGSRFTVWLPRQTGSDSGSEQDITLHSHVLPEKRLKILVVDDNIDAAETLRMLLESVGHQVITEYDAQQVMDLVRGELPEVCVLDIGLPGLDGNELAHCLRVDPNTANIFLIALSGYSEPRSRDVSLKAGFDLYMTKPVDLAALQSALAAVPSRRHEN